MRLKEIVSRGRWNFTTIREDGLVSQPHSHIWVVIVNKQWVRVFDCGDKGLELVSELVHLHSGCLRDPFSFSDGITGWLEEAARNEAFDRLILMAPFKFMFDMKSIFSESPLNHIIDYVEALPMTVWR